MEGVSEKGPYLGAGYYVGLYPSPLNRVVLARIDGDFTVLKSAYNGISSSCVVANIEYGTPYRLEVTDSMHHPIL